MFESAGLPSVLVPESALARLASYLVYLPCSASPVERRSLNKRPALVVGPIPCKLSHSLGIQSLILPDLCTPKVANPSSFYDMPFFGQNRDIEKEFTLSRFSWNR